MSLTNITINFYETFLFEWALGFLHMPFGGTRLQEAAGEEPSAMTGFVQIPQSGRSSDLCNTWSFT